ncbi:MAG: hypothetical protein WCY15_15195 [Phenylobacterium sp.]|uniref:hypothetical protein n=1 Tax=Phenylobacterium sp. TaxID=1871053 RepID=UPI00355E5B27
MRVAPLQAAVLGEWTNNSAKEVFASEETDPGFRFFLIDLTKEDSAFAEAFAKATVSNRIDGFYTLSAGGMGANFHVDMRVRSFEYGNPASLQLASDAGDRLKRCMDDLFELAEADAKAQ